MSWARWVLASGLVLMVAGGILVTQGSGDDLDRRELIPSAQTVERDRPGSAASPVSPGRPEGTEPGEDGALAVSEPKGGRHQPFESGSRRNGAPRVRQGQAAHPERASFEPAAVRFELGSYHTGAPVDRVETMASGSLELPADPARVGWWSGGSAAGAPYGSVVLAGHLDSKLHGIGFSARMAELTPGDVVVLSDDDQDRRYQVQARYLLPRTRLAALTALFSDLGPARLVMLTCGGDYDAARGAYSDNLVVEATPVG